MKIPESFAAVDPKKAGEMEAAARRKEQNILETFSPEEQRIIVERQRLLSSLGFFIGKDFEMPILLNEPGAGWHWNFKENHIRVDPKDLLEKPLDYLRFVISHEGGHRRISRTDFIPEDVWKQLGFSFMMNAIEDPRDNNFVAEAYPRFREQMNLAYTLDHQFEQEAKELAKKKIGSVPRFLQAGHEYIKQWFKEATGEEFAIDESLPKEVQEVVRKTLSHAQDSWWRYPSKEEADEGEELITRYAEASYRINLDKVWPEFKKLVDEDVKDQKTREALEDIQKGDSDESGEGEGKSGAPNIPQELGDKLTPEERRELEGALRPAQRESGEPKAIDPSSLSPELRKKIEEYIDSLPEEVKRELAKRAQEALKAYEDEVRKPLEAKLPADEKQSPPEETPRTSPRYEPEADTSEVSDALREIMEQDQSMYGRTMREVLSLIDRLEDDLREIFVARRARKWETGHRFGKKIDIKKRMQEKVQGVSAAESRAWQRREAPQEKDYAISVLVDLSGSMRGRKIAETFKAVVVLTEVLNKLSIKTEVLGFNDRIHEFKRFTATMSEDVRGAIGTMLGEVNSERARYNDDGWALEQASARLSRQDAGEKFLIVLSDGIPEPSPGHRDATFELKVVVDKITGETDQKLVGLGIGPGTKHVETYYPNNLADVPVSEMAEKLSDLLREVIANYESF